MSKGPKIRDIDYYEDLTGQTIGRLTIVSLDKRFSKTSLEVRLLLREYRYQNRCVFSL